MTTHDHSRPPNSTRTTVLTIAASGCVFLLAVLLFDVPGIIVVGLLGIPASIVAWRFMAYIFFHEAAIDAQLAAWQARRRARRTLHTPTTHQTLTSAAYTGETVKLDEVAR